MRKMLVVLLVVMLAGLMFAGMSTALASGHEAEELVGNKYDFSLNPIEVEIAKRGEEGYLEKMLNPEVIPWGFSEIEAGKISSLQYTGKTTFEIIPFGIIRKDSMLGGSTWRTFIPFTDSAIRVKINVTGIGDIYTWQVSNTEFKCVNSPLLVPYQEGAFTEWIKDWEKEYIK